MRLAFLAILTGILTGISHIASAESAENAPMVCEESKKVFDLLKKRKFYPVIIGESENMQTAVFLNSDRDMIIALTTEGRGKNITCVFVGGEKNTQIFRLPQEPDQDQKL
mgnify:FL=1